MAKNYSREEIKELLKEKLKAAIIFQYEEEDYNNEYHILNKLPNGTYKHIHGAVVSMLSAIKKESDFGSNEDWKEFIIDLAKKLADDEELFNQMVESAKDFWKHVQEDTPPDIMLNDDETLKELYSASNEVMIELYPEDEDKKQAMEIFEEKAAYLQELKGHIKDMQDEQKEIETFIKDIIKDNLGIKTQRYVITWKSQNKVSLDTKRIKEERPEVYEKYAVTSSYRVMRITNNKEMAV